MVSVYCALWPCFYFLLCLEICPALLSFVAHEPPSCSVGLVWIVGSDCRMCAWFGVTIDAIQLTILVG